MLSNNYFFMSYYIYYIKRFLWILVIFIEENEVLRVEIRFLIFLLI